MQAQVGSSAAKGKSSPPSKAAVAIVIFGKDTKGKAHAAAFAADEIEAAKQAASLMKYAAWSVTDAGRSLATKVPKGVIFGSGRARASLVSKKLMAELELMAGPAPKPSGKADPAPAAQTPSAGLSEAAGGQSGASGGSRSAPPPDSVSAPPTRPTDWASIAVGAVVLATTGGTAEGWFECIVLKQTGDDLLELSWRDFPEDVTILRRRDNLGLLPPTQVG